MSTFKRIAGVLVLIIFIAIISIYVLLPRILTSIITTSLQDAGLHVDKLTVTQVGTDHVEIPHARFTNADGTTFDLEQLSVDYSISQIVSGTVESISVQQVDIHLNDKKSNPIEALSRLHHMLGNDLSTIIPLASATINSLELHDPHGKSLLQAAATLKRDKKALNLDMEVQTQNGETRRLHIIQQQPGQWQLQAVDPDGSKLVDASFQQAQEFPLNIELNASLKQLKPWTLLFGLPLPEYQATTQAIIQLKPDYNKKTIQFKLDAESQDIRKPELTVQSAVAAISGEAAMHKDGQIELTTRTDFSMAGLKRDNLSADTLHFWFDSKLMIKNKNIQGSFVPGLNIETHNLNLFDTHIEYASLESVTEQQFNWNSSSGIWQLEKNSLQVKKVDAIIGNTIKLKQGVFDLYHTAWSYPLKGTTNFDLTGTARSVQQDSLQLTDNTVQLSGDIIWKTTKDPTSVSADIKLVAKQIRHNALHADNVLLKSKTHMVFKQNTLYTNFDKASRLTINKAKLGTTQIDLLRISLLKPLNMRWSSRGKPLKGMTSFKLTGTTGRVRQDSLKLIDSKVQLSGDILWKTAKNPTSVSADIQLATKNIKHNSLSADSALLMGKAKMVFKKNTLNSSFDKASRLTIKTAKDGATRINSPKISFLKKLHIQWNSKNKSLAINSNRFKLSHKGLVSKQATISPGTLIISLNKWNNTKQPKLTGTLSSDSIQLVTNKQRHVLKKTSATFTANTANTANGTVYTLSGKSWFQLINSRVHFDLSHDVASGRGSVTYRSDPQRISSSTKALKKMTPNWPDILQLVSGTTSVSGRAKWHNTYISATAILKLNDIGGRYGDTYFSGMNSNIDLNLLPIFKGKSRFFRIELIDVGVPINQFSTTLYIEKLSSQKSPVITLRNTTAKLLGGSINGNLIKLDLNRPSNNFTLTFNSIDIAELVKLHHVDGLNAIGKLSGTIPIHLGPEGISVSNGKSSTDKPGGSISYNPKDSDNVLKSVSTETELLLNVLRDFQYNKMDVTGIYKPDGKLLVRLEIKGKSPQYDKNRPVHFNLNLDQNILSLLKSMRVINGLNERLDRAVRKHYKSR